nr:MAG TPA: hypothetical protein [Caudoviricetes sp.]
MVHGLRANNGGEEEVGYERDVLHCYVHHPVIHGN